MARKQARRRQPSRGTKLDAMIEHATVDAYGADEQRMGFHAVMEERIRVPFQTTVLGVAVTIARIGLADDGAIVAVCSRGAARQAIAVLDLPLPDPAPEGSEWIEAYKRWTRTT